MVLWRSGYAAVCKTAYTGSIPVGASSKSLPVYPLGRVGLSEAKPEWRNWYTRST